MDKQQATFRYGKDNLIVVGLGAWVWCVKHPAGQLNNSRVQTSPVGWVDTDAKGNVTRFGTKNTVYTAV